MSEDINTIPSDKYTPYFIKLEFLKEKGVFVDEDNGNDWSVVDTMPEKQLFVYELASLFANVAPVIKQEVEKKNISNVRKLLHKILKNNKKTVYFKKNVKLDNEQKNSNDYGDVEKFLFRTFIGRPIGKNPKSYAENNESHIFFDYSKSDLGMFEHNEKNKKESIERWFKGILNGRKIDDEFFTILEDKLSYIEKIILSDEGRAFIYKLYEFSNLENCQNNSQTDEEIYESLEFRLKLIRKLFDDFKKSD